jgi:hypothetical protein
LLFLSPKPKKFLTAVSAPPTASLTLSKCFIRNSSTSLNVSTNVDGSHANGLGYVPFDGYIGRLHKGEAVLTAEENKAYRAGIGASVAAGTANPAGNVITRTVTDNSRKVGKLFENLVIHQQPGEDAEKLANRVMDKLYDAIQEAAEIAGNGDMAVLL